MLKHDFKDYDLLLSEADFYQIRPLIETVVQIQEDSGQNKSHSHYLEIIEVRIGTTATMPSKNSRVKTIMIGRKDVILVCYFIKDYIPIKALIIRKSTYKRQISLFLEDLKPIDLCMSVLYKKKELKKGYYNDK
jgi:hypothetical protein